jgi:hypothetical protein
MSTENKPKDNTVTEEMARKEAERIEQQYKKDSANESTYQTVNGQLLVG